MKSTPASCNRQAPSSALVGIESLWRIDLDADHELASIQLLAQAGRALSRDEIELRRGEDARATTGVRGRETGPRGHSIAAFGRPCIEGLTHRRRVQWSGAAAAADDAHPASAAPGEPREVLR